MANPDRPFGFIPTPLIRARRYEADASGAAIYPADIVELENDGYILTAAAADTELLGSSMDYSAATTASVYMAVADAQDQEFLCQDDGSGTSAQTNVGNNADHLGTTGNTTLKLSQQELAMSTITTSTAGFRINAFVRRPGYAIGANSLWLVTINEHTRADATGI